MLTVSEEPALARFDLFGPGMDTPNPRPEESICAFMTSILQE